MSLKTLIKKTGKKELSQLIEHFNSVYPEGYLPSHGLEHHLRVWQYAIELMMASEENDFPPGFIEKLLIGCMLHDSGMAVETGIRHGYASRKNCEAYLFKTGRSNENYYDLLDAVENHDNKEYDDVIMPNELHTFLTIADDLDAFGKQGAARYLEIYRARGINEDVIPGLVIKNAASRFNHFRHHFSKRKKLFNRHKKRYLALIETFSSATPEIR